MRGRWILPVALLALGASAPPALGDEVSRAELTRLAPGRYRVSWETRPAGAPVDVLWSADPSAAPEAMRIPSEDDRDGVEEIEARDVVRPYVFLRTNGGSGVRVAERVLPLEGGRNFRDLGGYATADGRHVRWGRAYRSGVLANLTDADYRYLSALGIRVVCDLRSAKERLEAPTVWKGPSPTILTGTRDVDPRTLFPPGEEPTAAVMRAGMIRIYERAPYDHAERYRELFGRLAGGEVPVAFHCSAGKDRTGVLAALLLTVLGVPRETVMADYVLSDQYFTQAALREKAAPGRVSPLDSLAPDARAVLLGIDPAYLEAAFRTIETTHGSVMEYVRAELAVGPDELGRIRTLLLE